MSATAVCEEQVQVRRERRPCGGPTGITLGQLLTRAHEGVLAHGTAELSRLRRHARCAAASTPAATAAVRACSS